MPNESIEQLGNPLRATLTRIFAGQTNPVTVTVVSPGEIELSANVRDLEGAVAQRVNVEAKKHGASVEEVQLDFRELGPRALEVEAQVRAKKMFFATTVRVVGRLQVDEQMNAEISGLQCSGEGTIGSMASGFLAPYLQELNGRRVSLLQYSLGELRLQDMRFQTGERIALVAQFSQ